MTNEGISLFTLSAPATEGQTSGSKKTASLALD